MPGSPVTTPARCNTIRSPSFIGNAANYLAFNTWPARQLRAAAFHPDG